VAQLRQVFHFSSQLFQRVHVGIGLDNFNRIIFIIDFVSCLIGNVSLFPKKLNYHLNYLTVTISPNAPCPNDCPTRKSCSNLITYLGESSSHSLLLLLDNILRLPYLLTNHFISAKTVNHKYKSPTSVTDKEHQNRRVEITIFINNSQMYVSAIYRSACTAPRIFETQDEGQRQCMGLQYRKREQGKQCELRRLRR
jgi:hypothetical protein